MSPLDEFAYLMLPGVTDIRVAVSRTHGAVVSRRNSHGQQAEVRALSGHVPSLLKSPWNQFIPERPKFVARALKSSAFGEVVIVAEGRGCSSRIEYRPLQPGRAACRRDCPCSPLSRWKSSLARTRAFPFAGDVHKSIDQDTRLVANWRAIADKASPPHAPRFAKASGDYCR